MSEQLPSLKATVRLGGQTKAEVDSIFAVYAVKFYPYTLSDPIFAICGDRHVIVCRCVLEENRTVDILHWQEDADVEAPNGEALCYNSVAWSQAKNGDPLLCFAGNVQITILNITTKEVVTTLIGHGDGIHDLAVSPADPTILASCSIDYTVRIWSLDPIHAKQPLAATCYGQGSKDPVMTVAFHHTGRFLLSAGMDTKVNLWVMPDDLQTHAGTDKPAMIYYPHFSTAEIHTDFVHCVRWYNDLILSHACREDKIILWKIDNFSSAAVQIPDAPVPTSNVVTSKTPVIVPANSTTNTYSAWGGRLQRLLQFELPDTSLIYMRFSLFHELGQHPILVAGNEKSKAFFWDLQRLEEAGTSENGTQHEATKGVLLGLPRHVREGTSSSAGSSAISTTSGTTKGKRKKTKEPYRDPGIANPFRSIRAHESIEIPKYAAFPFRQFSWSRGGQWCVGVGDSGLINVFHRWEKGIPPPTTEPTVG